MKSHEQTSSVATEIWQSNKLRFFFCALFFYSLSAMLLWRLLLLPSFTSVKAGELPGDTSFYAGLAVEQAEAIKTFGFSVFELRPEGHGAAGIASLVYLASGTLHAIVLVNAFLHLVACLALYALLRLFFSRNVSAIGALPFAISPCMMFWLSQTNKESYVFSGVFLFLAAYFAEVKCSINESVFSRRRLVMRMACIACALVLIAIVRSYVNTMMAVLVIATMLGTVGLARTWRGRVHISLVSLSVIFLIAVVNGGSSSDRTLSLLSDPDANYELLGIHGRTNFAARCFRELKQDRWTPISPAWLDRRFKVVAGQRCLTFSDLDRTPNPTILLSTIDTDEFFSSAADIIKYAPRAAVAGLFAPLPSQWPALFEPEISRPYKATIVEVFFGYFCFVFLLRRLVTRKRQEALWLLVAFSAVYICILTTSMPSLMIAYRGRYAFWMLLLSLGFASLLEVYDDRRRLKRVGLSNESLPSEPELF